MSFSFVNPWHLFLPREGGHVISFMGSGGKTSLQLLVAEVYQEGSLPVILTNTTQCEILPSMAAFHFEEALTADHSRLPSLFYLHNGVDEKKKWQGLRPEQVDQLGEIFPERIVLVEVDGARKLPLKFYRENEPVWPQRTSLAFLVMGVNAVGSKAGAGIHRWGIETALNLGKLRDESVLEWGHLKEILNGSGGYLDQLPANVPTVLALAGVNDQPDSIGLFEFVGAAMEHPRLPLVVFCSQDRDPETDKVVWNLRTSAVESGEDGR
ncbi:MAG: putative selenium-dependent hydroxylase accessory protein YqeC [Candidatus Krumholzibacteriia bacterium]|jgi:probable selenium-dependent hydroxylase accessory protein YqeC